MARLHASGALVIPKCLLSSARSDGKKTHSTSRYITTLFPFVVVVVQYSGAPDEERPAGVE